MMPDFDPLVQELVERLVPRREVVGDWSDVVARAGSRSRWGRVVTRRLALLAAAVLLVVTASAAQAGVFGRVVDAFTELLAPASPGASQAVTLAGRRFDVELQVMARQFPHKVSVTPPSLDLGAARQVATIHTPAGPVTWDAAVDHRERGYCQAGFRNGVRLGGACQETDRGGYAISVATSGDLPGSVVVTGLAPASAEHVVVSAPRQPSKQARRIGEYFFTIMRTGSPITVTITDAGGSVARRATFGDPVCVGDVGQNGQPLIAGTGFTYCAQGGVIAGFPASGSLAPVCRANGCAEPTIQNNQQPAPSIPKAATPTELLDQITANLDTPTIQAAQFAPPPQGYGTTGNWLYVTVTHTRGADGVLADFNALLLAGAYARQAPSDGLPELGGVSYLESGAVGCSPAPNSATCDAVSWRANLQPAASPTTSDAATLETQIRLALAKVGLQPVSITFTAPLGSLVPIVVARTNDPANIQLATLTGEVFGPATDYQGTYLKIIDQHDQPVAAHANESDLGIAVTWNDPSR
jgi:hypothetical protein